MIKKKNIIKIIIYYNNLVLPILGVEPRISSLEGLRVIHCAIWAINSCNFLFKLFFCHFNLFLLFKIIIKIIVKINYTNCKNKLN